MVTHADLTSADVTQHVDGVPGPPPDTNRGMYPVTPAPQILRQITASFPSATSVADPPAFSQSLSRTA
ncbi:MAG: hypothetical protein ACJAY5_000630 [Actinomycetes bacterium]|jgi:hypothetical protein